jgi:hypothetical protein
MSKRVVSEAFAAGRKPSRAFLSWGAPLAGARLDTVRHLSQAVALACLLTFGLLALSQVHASWWMQDADAYWRAAERLRDGLPLYPPLGSQDASAVYRYTPWFAVVWIPLTFLPQAFAFGAWGIVLMGSVGACIWASIRTRTAAGFLVALLMLAMLAPAAASGNVQPLLVASLLLGVERRSGPLWIALAASLKAAPILLIAVYLGRRQWLRAAVAGILTLALVLPILAFDLSHYPADVGAAAGPIPEWAGFAAAAILAIAAVPLARTKYGWLAAGAAIVFAIPRWSYYQASFVMVGAATPSARHRQG